jgi:hypothetical protein
MSEPWRPHAVDRTRAAAAAARPRRRRCRPATHASHPPTARALITRFHHGTLRLLWIASGATRWGRWHRRRRAGASAPDDWWGSPCSTVGTHEDGDLAAFCYDLKTVYIALRLNLLSPPRRPPCFVSLRPGLSEDMDTAGCQVCFLRRRCLRQDLLADCLQGRCDRIQGRVSGAAVKRAAP